MPTVDLNASYQRNLSVPVNFLPAAIFDPSAGPDDYLPVQFGADNPVEFSDLGRTATVQAWCDCCLGGAQRFENLQVEAVRGEEQAVVTQVQRLLPTSARSRTGSAHREICNPSTGRSLEETRALNQVGLADDYAVLRSE